MVIPVILGTIAVIAFCFGFLFGSFYDDHRGKKSIPVKLSPGERIVSKQGFEEEFPQISQATIAMWKDARERELEQALEDAWEKNR